MDAQEDTLEELNRKRNSLFALQLLITIITMAFSFVAMVSGIFGMNLRNGHENDQSWFKVVTAASLGGASVVVAMLIVYLHNNRMVLVGASE
jgi:Mg2+ and Co2+ transporter CorA